MFRCPYKQCIRTFARRAALREHLKTHEGEVYWEKLNNTSNINRITTEQQQERIRNDEKNVDNNNEIYMINEDEEMIDIINNEDVINNENENKEIDVNENEETEYITVELVR